jgi:hypothetical protein
MLCIAAAQLLLRDDSTDKQLRSTIQQGYRQRKSNRLCYVCMLVKIKHTSV